MADENVGGNPPDFNTLAGQVRLLVGDTNPRPLTPTPAPDPDDPPVPGDPDYGQYAWYSDAELEALGDLHGLNPKRVAIWVLSQVAISQALLLKKWTSEDLQVDGPAITRGIESTLKRLAAEVEREEDLAIEEDFLIAGGVEPVRQMGWFF